MGPPCTRFRPDGAKSQTTSSAAMKYSRVAPRDGAAGASSRSAREPAAPRGRGRAGKAPATQADAVRTPRVPRGADVVSPVGLIGSLLESHHPLERGGANAGQPRGGFPPPGRPCRLLLRHAVERAEPEHQVDGVNADHAPPGKELGEGLERLARRTPVAPRPRPAAAVRAERDRR